MEFVLFSEYVALYDFISNVRLVNKEYYRWSTVYFRMFKRESTKRKGKSVMSTRYRCVKCAKCDQLRSCRTDPFSSVDGFLCMNCQEPVVCLTKVRKILDRDVIQCLNRLEWSGGTYFLQKDVEAHDFLFEGPNDRRIVRERKSDSRIQQRFRKVQDIYTKHDVTAFSKQFNYCIYINTFIYSGRIGIRAIKSLIVQCSKKAIEIYNEIETMNRHKRLHMSLGTVLSWAVRNYELPRFTIDVNKMESEKHAFFQLVERIEQSEKERAMRKEELIVAFKRHDFPLDSIDRYPYVSFGEPSVETTCEKVHMLKWLHECTPFCDFVERNKINRGYSQDYIQPDPFYNMIYSVCIDAKTMVLSLGYICPPFCYISK